VKQLCLCNRCRGTVSGLSSVSQARCILGVVSKSRCLGKRNRRGEAKLGSESAASQPGPTFQVEWIADEWARRLASRSVFAWLNCGVTSQSFSVWAGDPEASLSEHTSRATSAWLRRRILNTHPVAGTAGFRMLERERDRGSGGRKEALSLAHPQRRMQAIYNKHAGRSIEGRGEQGKKVGLDWVYGANRLDWTWGRTLAGPRELPEFDGPTELQMRLAFPPPASVSPPVFETRKAEQESEEGIQPC
jgi:hypothetical protein